MRKKKDQGTQLSDRRAQKPAKNLSTGVTEEGCVWYIEKPCRNCNGNCTRCESSTKVCGCLVPMNNLDLAPTFTM